MYNTEYKKPLQEIAQRKSQRIQSWLGNQSNNNLIEKLAKRGVSNFPSMILAILFKREDLSPKEHYVLAHIEQKAKLFEKHCTADFALPYITLVARRTLKSLENVESNNGSGMAGDSQS